MTFRLTTARHTGALRAAGRLRRVPGRGHGGRRAARPAGRDWRADRLRGGGRSDVVCGRAGRVGPAGRHRLAHRRRVLPPALRAAAADRDGRRACRRRGRRDVTGLRRPRPGVPLVRPTAHTGKHGYVYGYARPPLCRQGHLERSGRTGARGRGRRHRPAAAPGRGAAGGGHAAAAHLRAHHLPAAPGHRRRAAHLPGRRGGGHGAGRVLARRAGRGGGQPAAELVLHRADPHVHHPAAQGAAGSAAVRDRRGRGQQRGPPGRPARRARPRGPGKRRPRCSSSRRPCWAAPTPPRPCSST